MPIVAGMGGLQPAKLHNKPQFPCYFSKTPCKFAIIRELVYESIATTCCSTAIDSYVSIIINSLPANALHFRGFAAMLFISANAKPRGLPRGGSPGNHGKNHWHKFTVSTTEKILSAYPKEMQGRVEKIKEAAIEYNNSKKAEPLSLQK